MKTMKQLFFFLMIFCASMYLSACSDDDGDELSLIGTYALSEESTSGCADPAENVTETYTCTTSDCETLIVNKDGGFSYIEIASGVTTTTTGTYTTSGSTITFAYTVNGVAETDVATFSLTNSGLVLTFEQDSDGCIDVETYTKQ